MTEPKRNHVNAIVIERIFDASPERLFKAWSDPEQVAKWYGPEGFSLTVCEIDFRLGGKFLYHMSSDMGHEFWYGGVYTEIIENELIACTNYMADPGGNPVPSGMDGWPDESTLTVRFEDTGGKTKLTLTHEGLPPSEMRDRAAGGYIQTLDKLANHLEEA